LPEAEFEVQHSGLHLRQTEPRSLLTIGQRARIRPGALVVLEGVMERKTGSPRVVLTMKLILHGIAAEVQAEQLETVASFIQRNS
jgi:hypothetical protein